ncbi:PD-(D/E)XK nuclease family protein [Streptomyces johnsoniae]|uniref:PD-(D/E)XK nuclease family protein n=1 Tax=Streptomyces johnsoniae TaxID=3075532 RepID=A0ABU2SDM2_9ACTN|nr:PD-(D/E)XK nuclease family protein [Streptomyces sp. DSM 41886]MDT0447043.1 PD-(D/E)XK nuclease family protein [Streptomyces sp. DSM 41886]
MAGSWPPDGLVGKSRTITVRLGMFGPERYRCPASDALTARGLRPGRPAARKPEELEMFVNGPFMAAAGAIERPRGELPPAGPTTGGRPAHDGVQRWTEHALRTYAEAFPVDPELRPVRRPWVYRHRRLADSGQEEAEFHITAWGRQLESSDGRRRELRLPVTRLRARSAVERAVAALVAAEGNADAQVENVRVVQFALADGRTDLKPLFEGTRAEALAAYRADGAPAVRALLDSREYRPGTACVSCAVAPVCPALTRAPGLLGTNDLSRPRRVWSSTTGRAHRACPARGYLRGLRLPADDAVERSPAAERGRAVHAFLAERHRRCPSTPCDHHIVSEWVPDGFRLPEEERRLGAELLRHHAEVCPLRVADSRGEVRVEPRLVFDDTAADLVVLADPDLLYQDAGSWVWREIKTSASGRPPRDVLAAYPQLALAISVVGGALGSPRARGRVELEVLRPGGVDLRTFDPYDAETREAAETLLRGQLSGWHAETRFEAVPGPQCTACEVARWCSAGQRRNAGQEAAG